MGEMGWGRGGMGMGKVLGLELGLDVGRGRGRVELGGWEWGGDGEGFCPKRERSYSLWALSPLISPNGHACPCLVCRGRGREQVPNNTSLSEFLQITMGKVDGEGEGGGQMRGGGGGVERGEGVGVEWSEMYNFVPSPRSSRFTEFLPCKRRAVVTT